MLATGQYQYFIYLKCIICTSISLNILIFYLLLHTLFNPVMSPLFLIHTEDKTSASTYHLLFVELLFAHPNHMAVSTDEPLIKDLTG